MTNWFEWRDAPAGDYAVIGDPIGHSLSPEIHQAAFRAINHDFEYHRIRVPENEFERAMQHLTELEYKGVNATVPLKEKAFWWCESTDVIAQSIGAVNTIKLANQEGTNTDAIGFLDTLMEYDIEPPGPALLLGAGGSARAVAIALVNSGFELWVWARQLEKAEQFVGDLEVEACIMGEPDPNGAELIINATSAGLSGESPELLWDRVEPTAVAYDLMYGISSPFLAHASNRCARTMDGLPLLLAQAARSFEWWHGVEAPRAAMLAALQ